MCFGSGFQPVQVFRLGPFILFAGQVSVWCVCSNSIVIKESTSLQSRSRYQHDQSSRIQVSQLQSQTSVTAIRGIPRRILT